MKLFDYHRTVIAYHGCDAVVANSLLNGGSFERSKNKYDWLGEGIYFWEFGPERAMEWARQIHERRPDKVKKPEVVGAVLQLGTCFDLLDTRFTRYLSEVFPQMEAAFAEAGIELPANKAAADAGKDLVLRFRDCAVLNWAIPKLEKERGLHFHTVRCAFLEGGDAYEGAAIRAKSHIQIAVRDTSAIVGVFRPSA